MGGCRTQRRPAAGRACSAAPGPRARARRPGPPPRLGVHKVVVGGNADGVGVVLLGGHALGGQVGRKQARGQALAEGHQAVLGARRQVLAGGRGGRAGEGGAGVSGGAGVMQGPAACAADARGRQRRLQGCRPQPARGPTPAARGRAPRAPCITRAHLHDGDAHQQLRQLRQQRLHLVRGALVHAQVARRLAVQLLDGAASR